MGSGEAWQGNVDERRVYVYVTDDNGNPLNDVYIQFKSQSYANYYGYTDDRGRLVFHCGLYDHFYVWGKKEGYGDYPDWSYLGEIPSNQPDYVLSAVMTKQVTPAPPPQPVYVNITVKVYDAYTCLLYTSPSPRD